MAHFWLTLRDERGKQYTAEIVDIPAPPTRDALKIVGLVALEGLFKKLYEEEESQGG